MAGNLAHISTSNDNIIELDKVRPGSSGRGTSDCDLCPDLCPVFSTSPTPRKVRKSQKRELTPALIDDMRGGKFDDSKTGALSIEVLSSGKKRWLYRRRIAGRGEIVKLSLGLYPAYSIADAREWANGLNLQIDAGIDPRETARQELRLATMTVDRAHELYMEAVREGRSSRAKRPNKPRTVADKEEIYRRDIAPKLGRKIVYDVTEADLIKLVEAKGKKARVRANRLAAELKVFFGWTASLRGLEVGLEVDPSRRLGDLRFPETPRARRLALQEIAWFLEALAEQEREYRRGMLLWLLTAARLAEVCQARSDELSEGVSPGSAATVTDNQGLSMQWVMGLGGSNHDFSAALLHGGAPHTSIEDERLTRKRYGDNHWASAPCRPSAGYCLTSAGLELGDLDGLFVSNDIEGHDRFWQQRSHTVVGHHLCHASAAYYASPFDEAALLVVDGRGGPVSSIEDGRRTFETISMGEAAGSSLELETVQTGQHHVSTSTWRYISSNSIGWFYSIVTECVGMGENGEGKTMALAAFGEPRFKNDLLQFVSLGGEQLFEMDPYSGLWSFLVDTVAAADRSFAVRADLAASAQSILEDVLIAATRRLRKQSNKRYLAFGGGVALNGVANRRIREESGFDDLFVFPASGDNGLSVGAALYGYHHLGRHPVTDRSMARSVSFAFGGRCYGEGEMEQAARAFAVSVQRPPSRDELVERLTTALLNGSIVAIFQDGSEFGPRALGNRSLIALPSTPNIQRRLNRIKHRESFRPFAPIVLEEEADVYFEATAPSPFMLEMSPIRKQYREELAGAAHVDGTARLQTIGPYQQGLVRCVLHGLKRRGRPPVIINTSFNLKGKPIVEDPRDAMVAFVQLDVEALLMGPFWIEKQTPLAAKDEKVPQDVS